MIVNTTRRIFPLTARMLQSFSQKRIESFREKQTRKNPLQQIALQSSQIQSFVKQEKQHLQRLVQQTNSNMQAKCQINMFVDQNGRKPVIISDKSNQTFLTWDLGAGVSWIALLWELWAGTTSYAVVGVTAVAALVLSRESAYRFFKDTAPEIVEVWVNKQGNYEIQLWKNASYQTVTVEKSLFKFGVSGDCNRYYSTFLKLGNLHHILPDPSPGIWCTIDGQACWLASQAQINNILLHSLI